MSTQTLIIAIFLTAAATSASTYFITVKYQEDNQKLTEQELERRVGNMEDLKQPEYFVLDKNGNPIMPKKQK